MLRAKKDLVSILVIRARGFSLYQNLQTVSGAHAASSEMGAGGCFSGNKVVGKNKPFTLMHFRGLRKYGTIPPLHQYTFAFFFT
jgi:hypothetical protein